MEKIDIIVRIAELLGAAILGGWVSRILTVKARVRTENAGADKAETEVKADQIQNIQDIVEKVYKPTIETLEGQVKELRWEVGELRKENARVILENEELKTENTRYRKVIFELRPDLVAEKPDRRGENGKSQARNADGTFAKSGSNGEQDGDPGR